MAFNLTSEIPSLSPYSYHVFLSFRGEDTGKTFTDHLYTALFQAGIRTFLDDDGLPKGQNLKSEISKGISESKCSIIIMSSSYSSSIWCLDELVMILEHKRRNGHFVLPVYYDVEPTQVRNQTGMFAEAFLLFETEIQNETDSTRKMELENKVKQWRGALKEVADLAGMVLKDQVNGHESKLIKKIVKVISGKLNLKVLSMTPYLVGMQSRVEKINLWLQDKSTDASILIISGIGGIGKTTIAKFVYNLNFQRFEGSSFIANVRETSMQPNGLVRLQRLLLSDILNTKLGKIHNVDEGVIKIQGLLQCKRFFLILDDVDKADQLDAVFGMRNRFCQGSKIIVTTRNKRLIRVDKTCEVHRVQELDNKESLHLFRMHAFGPGNPAEDYLKLSQQIVSLCGGLPLALQVLGSSLSGKSLDVWRSASRKLELFPDSQIVNKLQISYDALPDDHDKNLFLDIACFFIGKHKKFAQSVLDACGFYTAVGIESLMDGYLLEIDEFNKLGMHQLLRDMARDIIRRESPKEPGKRSRLWRHQDSHDVLRDKSVELINHGTESLESLCLDMHILQNQKSAAQDIDRSYEEVVEETGSSSKEFPIGRIWGHPASASERHAKVLETSAFERMQKLRVLFLNQVDPKGNFKKFPKGLSWLEWLRYPHSSIPREFPLGEWIALELRYGTLKTVFKGTKGSEALEGLYLDMHGLQNRKSTAQDIACRYEEVVDETGSSSKQFHVGHILGHPASASSIQRHEKVLETTAFEGMHRLRILLLNQAEFTGNFKKFPKGLRWLEWLQYPHKSIPGDFPLGELVALDLRYSNLKNVFKGTKVLGSLKFLNLGHCHSLCRTPDFKFLPSLESLILKDCTSLTEIDESIGCLHNLVYLNLKGCKNLSKLPRKMGILISLEVLIISGCTKVDNLTTTIMKLGSLKVLGADGINSSQLPSATKDFRSWIAQIFGRWKSKEKIIQGVPWLSLPCSLVKLTLVNCDLSETIFPGDFGNLNLLQNLNLSRNPIRCLPDCIRSLRSLKVFTLISCERLKSLLRLPKVEYLFVKNCSSLQKITYLSPDQAPDYIDHTDCKQLWEIEGFTKPEPVSEMTDDHWNYSGMENIQIDTFYRPGCTRTNLPDQVIDRRLVISRFLLRRQLPDIINVSTETSVAFQVNRGCNRKMKYLSMYCAYTLSEDKKEVISEQPFLSAKIINKSKNLTSTYSTRCVAIPLESEEMMWLSKWEIRGYLAIEDKNIVQVEVALTKLFKFKELGFETLYGQYVPDASIDYSACRVRSKQYFSNR